MNITNDRQKKDDIPVYCGTLSLKEGYAIANGDEYAYIFLGENSVYAFTDLAHPDDKQEILDALMHVDEGEQCLIARIKAYNGEYRWLYLAMSDNGIRINDTNSVDIKFTDIMMIRTNYDKYVNDIKKYRGFLGMTGCIYYEYEYSSRMLQIYSYDNTKSKPILNENIDELLKNVRNNPAATGRDKVEFDAFVKIINNGADRVIQHLNGELFKVAQLESEYEVRGCTMYKNDSRYKSIGVMRSVEKSDRQQSYYETEAAIDPGTGLLNKRGISEYTHERLADGRSDLYLAIMDIDDFKNVNDTFGHLVGDQVLSKVSGIVRSAIGARGTVGRFGGDEFFILFEGVESEIELRRILKVIAKHILWAYPENSNGPKVTVSVGVSKYPDDGDDYDILFRKADKALYIAKEKGKNRFVIYNEAKHGAIDIDNDTEIVAGNNSVFSNEKKIAVCNQLLEELYVSGAQNIEGILRQIQQYYIADGIAIYSGENMERVYSVGEYVNPISKYPLYSDKNYRELFDSNGVLCENKTKALDNRCPAVAKRLQKQETTAVLQVLYETDEDRIMISFDIFNRLHKRSEADKNFLSIIGRMICYTMIKNK